MKSSARISNCGKYRYWLERRWGKTSPQVFIMLNPSTADANEDDPTITRCINFAKREGAGGLIVVNLFAYRATDPKELDNLTEAELMHGNCKGNGVGTLNTHNIGTALLSSSITRRPVIAAWGSNKHAVAMSQRIIERCINMDTDLVCFKINKDGQPKHPLYVANDEPLISYP